MTSTPASQHLITQRAALDFVKRWKNRGREKSDTQAFWLDLCANVLKIQNAATKVRFEDPTADGGWIDVRIDDAKTFIEQKSSGIDLDKPEIRQGTPVTPFQQAKRYADSQTNRDRPDTIITCNFDCFRIHDLNKTDAETNFVEFALTELPEQLHLLSFLADPTATRHRREEKVSIQAGEIIGHLYDLLKNQYANPDSSITLHSLNILCVRLVFCLFAEDAGLFTKNALYDYLRDVQPRDLRHAIGRLFTILDTPIDQRDHYDRDDFKGFPYVNGGLFAATDVEIPPFTPEIKNVLLEEVSANTDWSQISPTVFGSVFESTLNPETRRSGGMHYTSVKNIHRVIGPLFLETLTEELNTILTDESLTQLRRANALKRFHDKIASLHFLDPACGSGNFLTETYICLRRLEKVVIAELYNNQAMFAFGTEENTPLKVSLRQFHGIEINDFACSVATTALWIAKLQADLEIESLVYGLANPLPLTDAANIRCTNALTANWDSVLPPKQCDYIIGNPPFLGARNQSKQQKSDLIYCFKQIGATKNLGNLDFVTAWYAKAVEYIQEYPVKCAFVSTNSVCQGEQVANLWEPLYKLGVHIDFAHDTFKWSNDASDQAAVFCVIVGFSKGKREKPRLYHYVEISGDPVLLQPKRLNPYLSDGPDVFIWNRRNALCNVPAMGIGNKPIDGGNYLFTTEEKEQFLAKEPGVAQYFHRWFGADEFLKGKERWVLWLGDLPLHKIAAYPHALERVQAVRQLRLESRSAGTQKLAARPTRFHVENIPGTSALLIPSVSSERRKYIPIGYLKPEDFASNLVLLVPDASLYHFGILHSRVHNEWMRTVCGRLEGRYRYSAGIVYNNFVWPETTREQQDEIAACANTVLKAREAYTSTTTLAKMYDPTYDWMFPELMNAHAQLDAAVEAAYGLTPGCDKTEIIEMLFELYRQASESLDF